MQDKLIEAVAKAIHNTILEGAGSASDWDTTMPPEVKQIYRAAALAAVRAHAAESAPQLDAEDPAEPVEDVVERMVDVSCEYAREHLQWNPDSDPQSRRNCISMMIPALAIAREGYVKLEDALDPPDDIECALADKGGRQRWQDAVREAFKLRRARLAPKTGGAK